MGSNPSLPLAACVALSRILSLSFITLNGHDQNIHLMRLSAKRPLETGPKCSKHPVPFTIIIVILSHVTLTS